MGSMNLAFGIGLKVYRKPPARFALWMLTIIKNVLESCIRPFIIRRPTTNNGVFMSQP